MFYLVLIFDCTYKTNMYRIPLIKIVSVTSTKLTFSIGFSPLEHEKEANFTLGDNMVLLVLLFVMIQQIGKKVGSTI